MQIDLLTEKVGRLEDTIRDMVISMDKLKRAFDERIKRDSWPWYKRVYERFFSGV